MTLSDPSPPSPESLQAREPERTWAVSARPTGELHARYSGPPSWGESDNIAIAKDLIYVFNNNGEAWGAPAVPQGPERGVDIEAFGPKGHLQLQITRVPRDPGYWMNLSTGGATSASHTPEAAANEIMEVIRSKAAKVPPRDRRAVTLVLDATKSMYFELPPVHNAFYRLHAQEALQLGFEDIMLVGSLNVLALLSPGTNRIIIGGA